MKKMIITVTLAIFCSAFVKAQTSTVSKKAILMPEGAIVTDLKTGETIRTVKGGVSISDIQRATINLFDPQNSGPGKTAEPAGSGNKNGSPSLGNTNKNQTPKSPKKD